MTQLQRGRQFTRADLDRILTSTMVGDVDFHLEIGSTNDRGLELTRQPTWHSPVLVLAETQTAGRGRGVNRWWSAHGALTFSLVVDTESAILPPECWPRASLTTGLAVCEALEDLLATPTERFRLKWPNDVYLDGRKVCGILIEVPTDVAGMIVLGIGINVNNSRQWAPTELQTTAIAICDAAGKEFDLADVLVRVLVRLEQRLSWIGHRDEQLHSMWRQRCLLTNRTVDVDQGMRQLRGVCRGIDDEGALVVDTDLGQQRCFAGVVTQFQ